MIVKWIDVDKKLPSEYEQRVLVKRFLPLRNSILQKICYDLAIYNGEEKCQLLAYVDDDAFDDGRVKLTSHTIGDNNIILDKGFYRSFEDWDGIHFYQLTHVVQWASVRLY